jgi:hypothetical protein
MKSGPYSRAVAPKAPRPAPAVRVKTEVRGGVLYIVGRCGATPVASPAIAQSFGGALARAGLL